MIWLGIYLIVSLPFILYAIIVGVTAGFTVGPVWRSLRLFKSKRKAERLRAILAAACAVIFILGALLLIYFWRVGGPNAGAGRHIFADGVDQYADLHVGMLLLFSGAALSVLVREMEQKANRSRIMTTIAVVAVLVVGTAGYTFNAYANHAGRVHQVNSIELAKLEALPPLYIPGNTQSTTTSNPDKPILMSTLNIRTGYQLTATHVYPSFEIVGWHSSDVKALFDPLTGACDVSGLSLGKPDKPGTCHVVAHVNGGALYMSTQPGDVYRPVGVFTKGDSVYYVAAGVNQAELISDVGRMKLITPEQAPNYLDVAL